VNVLTICFVLKVYDPFSLYIKYLVSPSITKSTKRLFSIDEEIDGKHTNVFFSSNINVVLIQASHCEKFPVISHLNGP